MKYSRRVSKTINDIVQRHYPYDERYGDGQKDNKHRIKYCRLGGRTTEPTPVTIECINKDLQQAGLKVNVSRHETPGSYSRALYSSVVIILNKDDC